MQNLAKAITTLYLDFIERRSEDRELERLETLAQNVTSINYGDDASHGSTKGDRLEKATIELAEYREIESVREIAQALGLSESWVYRTKQGIKR